MITEMDANDLCNKYLKNRLITNKRPTGYIAHPSKKIPYTLIKATLWSLIQKYLENLVNGHITHPSRKFHITIIKATFWSLIHKYLDNWVNVQSDYHFCVYSYYVKHWAHFGPRWFFYDRSLNNT